MYKVAVSIGHEAHARYSAMNDWYQGCCGHLGTRLALAVATDEQADIVYELMMRNAIYWRSKLS